ncbi:hypothetical protein GCM10023144_07570 [Pigmentiphaga soli]|uniref:Uncharacterized protein n=1 Tax=Pigmentiphaga soli TaxID=1007095 RepID=A0ABP8GJ29_9BURK
MIARLRRDMAEEHRQQDIKTLIWKKKLSATERMIQRDYDGRKCMTTLPVCHHRQKHDVAFTSLKGTRILPLERARHG